jgi:predicted choloylglycine hydrolase
MKRVLLTITILSMASCASTYRRPESIKEKMARYKSRAISTNKIPSYQVSSFKYSRGRVPASANADQDLNYSNKNLYFLSLYEQYESFSEVYPEHKKDLKHCPVYHQVLLDYKETPKKWSWSKKSKVDLSKSKIVAHLPKSKESVSIAMRDHMDRNYDELSKLCFTGASDNYYIYENLIEITKAKRIKKNKDGVNSLLKTTLFFNETLLHSVAEKSRARRKGRGLASTKKKVDFTQEALIRMKASWAKSLFE